jgi:subtilisin
LSIALFDHFLWTLQQGSLIWWLFLGLVASYSKEGKPVIYFQYMIQGIKKALFLSVLCLFIAGTNSVHAAESTVSSRYLIKSTSSFWKRTFNVRHEFSSGFTADLSDIQIGLLKLFGVDVEQVKVMQILPENKDDMALLTNTDATPSGSGRVLPSDQISWGVKSIYNEKDLTKTTGGDGAVIAVLDTGVHVSHLDLKARVKKCRDFTSAKGAIVDNACDDQNGHGTHVAGIALADGGNDGLGIFGIAPRASLFAYKVCNDGGYCYADDVAEGIRNATDAGANIINMSFGSDTASSLVKDAIDYATGKKVLLVAAAGNDGPFEDSIDYPAAFSSVIAVGSLDEDMHASDWSSRGNNEKTKSFTVEDRDIEFAAPGQNIESTSKSGDYVSLSGTSMASPFISGLAAKYWQSGSKNPAFATRELLHTMAKDILPEGDDDASGFGIIQLK